MITLVEAKAYMGVTSSTDDALITSFITNITAEIESVIGRPILQNTATGEVLNYTNSNNYTDINLPLDGISANKVVFTNYRPVSAVTLKDDGVAVDSENYRVFANEGAIELYEYISDKNSNLTVDYTYGWTTGTTPADFANTPQDLKNVALSSVKGLYESAKIAVKGSGEVKSKRLGGFSVTYATQTEEIINMAGMYMPSYMAKHLSTLLKYKNIGI